LEADREDSGFANIVIATAKKSETKIRQSEEYFYENEQSPQHNNRYKEAGQVQGGIHTDNELSGGYAADDTDFERGKQRPSIVQQSIELPNTTELRKIPSTV